MAERRMFAKTIIDSDAFLDMPPSARLLYYDLSMRADDDGFNNSPQKVIRTIGVKKEDLTTLIQNNFIIPFENGVIVIKHWRIHNYIRKDTYNKTPYTAQKEMLICDENKSYKLKSDARGRFVDGSLTQYSIGKDSIDKDNNIYTASSALQADKKQKHKHGEYKNVLLTDEELSKLKDRFPDWEQRINAFSEALEMKGYKYKSHYLAIIKWAKNEKTEVKPSGSGSQFPDER